MQTAKSAAASAKESAANVAASANAGMGKTKATVQEKAERMSAHDPTQKDMATERKQEKIHQAECNKQEARENNAAARQAIAAGGAGTFTAVGRAQNSTPGAVGTQGTQNYAAGGDHRLNTHPTDGHNPDHLTGSNTTGYGTGQHAQNLGGVNTRGADAVYPDDPIRSGPNPIRNTSDGAPGTGQGTRGTYQ